MTEQTTGADQMDAAHQTAGAGLTAGQGPPRVKNKISAEQLLREAFDRQEAPLVPVSARIADLEELHEAQGRKRKDFEDTIRRNRHAWGSWIRYAQWELAQREYARARSVFERALDVDPRQVALWLKYIESEIKHRNINHARNLFDRAVTILPRVDKFWFKYVYMEETLGNVAGTRHIFERWMAWEPAEAAWGAYINLEKRYGEVALARAIFARFTLVHPDARTWLKWVRFEEEYGTPDDVRRTFDRAVSALGDLFIDERIFIEWARYEARLKEYERARAIYRYALDRIPRSKSAALYQAYTSFEKQFGDKDGVEQVVVGKRRLQYEEHVRQNPHSYDTWFDYARLEETASSDPERVREVYERAIAQVPPSDEKQHWRRYIYLWLNYALYEELETHDCDRAREIYTASLDLIPHAKFTFAKVWILAALFEIRRKNVQRARKLMGQAIGRAPKHRLFRGYIEMEMMLKEYDRCRILHQKHLEFNPSNANAWVKFAELEIATEEEERWHAIYELGLEQNLDLPEFLWKSYINAEIENDSPGSMERARALYERLLQKTDHVKVWLSFAKFENTVEDEDDQEADQAKTEQRQRVRNVFERAYRLYKTKNMKEERIVLLEGWKSYEETSGSAEDVARIDEMMPQVVKRFRKLDDGTMEEYLDYVFKDDDDHDGKNAKMLKMLEMARAWKRQRSGQDEEQPSK